MRISDLFVLTVVYFITFLIAPTRVYAYLDPGSGSILFQVLVGGVLAIAATVRLYWRRFKSILKHDSTAPHPDDLDGYKRDKTD